MRIGRNCPILEGMNGKLTALWFVLSILVALPLGGETSDDATAETEEASAVVLPGATFELENGQRVNLRVENNNFELYLFPEKGKDPEELPYRLATLRYEGSHTEREFVRLIPSEDGEYLTSPHFVRKPYNYHIWLFLYEEDADGPTTKTKIRFRQD